MLTKRISSIVLIIALLLTVSVLPVTMAYAADADVSSTSANGADDFNLAAKTQDGNILQAFNWKLQEIKEHAAEIAAAGYSTVQISPLQYTKATPNSGSYAIDWWSFYQPNDYTLGNDLGTAAELKEVTALLHKYGIKVIADVVTNHTRDFAYKNKKEQAVAEEDWRNLSSTIKSFYRHNEMASAAKPSDSNRVSMTTGDLGGLKDINTENKTYQNYVINNLLIPLLNCGVDGFRFDAAKHIATPTDGSNYDYWPTVIGAIKNKKSDAYIYGEVLSLNNLIPISAYTQYMNVTDYAYGVNVRNALNSKNANSILDYGYTGSQKEQNVLWLESHDNFCDGVSLSLTKAQQIVGWAVVGARKDAPALYYPRPTHEQLDGVGFIKYDDLMGYYGSSDTWKSKAVVEVNKFKNAFVGQSEKVSASGSLFAVQRGNSGMVIANLSASSASVDNLGCTMADGKYTDQVTGNTFTVSSGKISGKIGSTGVAVIYNKTTSNSSPDISVRANGNSITSADPFSYATATVTFAVTASNTTSVTVKFGDTTPRSMTNGTTTFTIDSSVASGKSVKVTIEAKNGSKTITDTYTLVKDTNKSARRVYFDNTAAKWENVYVFCKSTLNATGTFPGIQMKLQSGNIYYAEVPANTAYVKFNEGPVTEHIGHSVNACGGYCGRTLPPTVIEYGTDSNLKDSTRTKGGYALIGTMICTDLHMEAYGNYSAAALTDSSITGGTLINPTTSTETQNPTQPTQPTNPTGSTTSTEPTQNPSTVVTDLLRGDADLSKVVDITDVTHIQRMLAKIVTFSEEANLCSDVDSDGSVSIIDATNIQRYLAKIHNDYHINEYITREVEVPATEAKETEAPTEATTPTSAPETQPATDETTPTSATQSTEPTEGDDPDITFVPGESDSANPSWFVWAWNDFSDDGVFISGDSDGLGNVVFAGAAEYDKIILLRMPENSASADWNKVWNQSDTISVEKNKTLNFAGWNNNKITTEWQ